MGNPQEENPDHKVFQIKCKINSPVAPAAFEESITQPSAHDNSWLLKTEPVTQRREIFLQLPNIRALWWGSSSDEATSLCKPELTLRKWTSNLQTRINTEEMDLKSVQTGINTEKTDLKPVQSGIRAEKMDLKPVQTRINTEKMDLKPVPSFHSLPVPVSNFYSALCQLITPDKTHQGETDNIRDFVCSPALIDIVALYCCFTCPNICLDE